MAMRIFLSPSVSRTEISSSSSSSFRARMPLFRIFFRDSTGRRLTVPPRVTITRKRSPVDTSLVEIMALTRSPGSTGRMLTIFEPLAVLPEAGIWYPFRR